MKVQTLSVPAGLAAAAACWVALAQAPLPKNHPPINPPDRRTAASRLTDEVAGTADRAAGPVARRNFIDAHIFGKMERDHVQHAPLAADGEFFRRVHFDLTGRLAEPVELDKFIASADPEKRDKLIDSLAQSKAFNSRWTYWFLDLSQAAHNRIGRDGVNLYWKYVYDNIHLNRPYNEMVEELLTANAASNWYVGPASYLVRWVVIGDNCADTVHEDTSDEIAITTARHFLGLNLQCVSCHDGKRHLEKINLWLSERKRNEVWQEAAFFGRTRLLRRVEIETTRDEYSIDDRGEGYDARGRSVVRIPRGGKGMVEPSFVLTGEKPDPSRPLRPQFARMVTSHPQFARATVNMIWAELMGVGIVDPVGDFDLARQDPKNPPPAPWTVQPTHPELLEALARDFREHNYDLQRLIKLIAKSSAYQLSSRLAGEWKESYAPYFARKFVRRLTAEELHDSIVAATELYTPVPIPGTDTKVRFAYETRTPEDYKQKGFKEVNFFLESFGQTNREYSERSNEGAITQAVMLMNSPFVKEKIKAAPGSHLALLLGRQPAMSDDDILNDLFRRFLGRAPKSEELAMTRELVRTDRAKGFEDVQWLLINKLEFIFNY